MTNDPFIQYVPQLWEHAPGYLIANEAGLIELRAAIDHALQTGHGRAEAFAWDGEGYWLCVATADEDEQVPSYYGGECHGSPEIGERIMRALEQAEGGE